jgi:hypothetical protein
MRMQAFEAKLLPALGTLHDAEERMRIFCPDCPIQLLWTYYALCLGH